MKMNSLVDRECIQALYRASQAGVPVEINVRGICCLRPGVPGRVGEHPRRLESSAASSSTRASTPSSATATWPVYIGSADLMPRNLDTRVELLTPVRDQALRGDLLDTLDRCFADNVNAWELDDRRRAGRAARRARPSRAACSAS